MADRSDYEVGRNKPPKHSRFKKGQSGNPGGRPRGARSIKTELEAELNEVVAVTVNGKTKKIRKQRLVISALTTKAIKGNVPAADKLIQLMIQAFGLEEQHAGRKALSATDQLILDQFLAGDMTHGDAPIEITIVDPGDEVAS